MKKILLTAFLIWLSTSYASSQEAFEQGDMVFSVGYGLGNTLHGAGYSNRFWPISAQFEYGIADRLMDGNAALGIGAYASLSGSKFKYSNTYQNITDLVIGGKLNFHYQFINRLDTYTGIMLGYNSVSASSRPQGIAKSQMCFMWNMGAKYYIVRNFAFMAEIGWGGPILNLGVAYNIKRF